jgi:hypothetical protein
MAHELQRRAVIELGADAGSLTDYSAEVSEFVINQQRILVQKAPSFGSPATEQKAGSGTATVSMTFAANPHSTTGVLAEMRTAQATTTGELYFEVRYSSAAVSASNPKFTGYIVVADMDTGGRIGEVRRISKTFPARAVSDPITS